ncbi:MAG: WbqC family protein [Vicinamibacterales bacterium]|nr:WbqC family protein [Vicinamibacterales bacterium]
MTLGIMQPYFLPYLGYWQLLARVDAFVVYDNIQYTKKGWINRNRYLRDGEPAWFTVPLKKASDYLDVREREVAPDFDRAKLLRALASSYRTAPQFDAVFPLVERVVRAPKAHLFDYVHHSLIETAAFLGVATPIVVSSTVAIDHTLAAERRVLALCEAIGAEAYLNPVGGQALYSAAAFAARGVRLQFLRPQLREYPQCGRPFVPGLSILDVLMFNSRDTVREMLKECDVLSAV